MHHAIFTKNLPFEKRGHGGWNTSFLECLSFPLTGTVLEKKFDYEGGRLKWFFNVLNFFRVLGSTLPLTMSPTSKYGATC